MDLVAYVTERRCYFIGLMEAAAAALVKGWGGVGRGAIEGRPLHHGAADHSFIQGRQISGLIMGQKSPSKIQIQIRNKKQTKQNKMKL